MNVKHLKSQTNRLRQELLNHPVFSSIHGRKRLQVFMEHHVWAVWDFMVLLKTLQTRLTSTEVLWRPVGTPEVRRLINEIVLAEESDLDEHGSVTSHFELYLEAMEEVEADSRPIRAFISYLERGLTWSDSLDLVEIPDGARGFVSKTLDIALHRGIHEVAAAFTYGREDLIPDMFSETVKGLSQSSDCDVKKLNYYLERHIEIDGDEHGHLSERMVLLLCGDSSDRWDQAESIANQVLQQRIELWDAVTKAF